MLVAVLLATMMTACGDPPVPKPRGYFRIDLPQREYRLLDSIYPYTFEIPVYAKITGDPHAAVEDAADWIGSLCAELAIPGLSRHGVAEGDIDAIVEQARKASSMKANPVELTAAELAGIVRAAL